MMRNVKMIKAEAAIIKRRAPTTTPAANRRSSDSEVFPAWRTKLIINKSMGAEI